jgi:hypothetical protein
MPQPSLLGGSISLVDSGYWVDRSHGRFTVKLFTVRRSDFGRSDAREHARAAVAQATAARSAFLGPVVHL